MATRSIGAGIAEGIEAGFGMGLRADEAALRKKADARADETVRIARGREDRAERRLDRQERISDLSERTKRLEARRGELVAASQAAQAAGGNVDPGAAAEFASVNKTLAQLRQEGENFFSRAATGQVDPLKASPEDLYTHLTAATGMTPAQIRQSTKHIADVTAGLQTSNEGLVIQGVNGLMQPQLNRGVGEASPHGGKILRKEVIGLDPAVDANMQPIPGKFMLRLRVYVQMPGMMTDKPLYYDAPMTVDGSSEGGAQVAVIDVKNGMNFMGNLGTLATAISRPDVLAKLEEGEKLAGARMKAALAELTAVSRPKAKGAAAERLETIRSYAKANGITDEESAKRLQKMGALPRSAGESNSWAQRFAMVENLNPDDPDYEVKKAALLGVRKAATDDVDMTDEAVTDTARAALKDKKALVGLGRDKTTMKRVLNRMAEIAHGVDRATVQADFSADVKSLEKLIPQYDAITAFKENAVQQGRVLKDLAGKVDTTGMPVFERWIRAGKQAVAGDEDVTEFNAQMFLYRAEAARILTQPSLTGVLSDNARHEVQEFLDKPMSAAQVKRVVDRLETDFGLRDKTLLAQIDAIRTRLAKDPAKTGKRYEGVGDASSARFETKDPAAMRQKIVASGDKGVLAAFDRQFLSGAQAKPAPPAVGAVVKGYRFKGGDPASQASWEKVQ
jgi:hypothetical protein